MSFTTYNNTENMTEMMKGSIPQFKTVNSNGYEIRTKVLEMAQEQVWQDYTAKYGAWETTVKKEGDEIVTTVKMPEAPGVEQVLQAAEMMYSFVTGKSKN
jgi:inorganic pyrophosphatase